MEQAVQTPAGRGKLSSFVHPLIEGRTYVESSDLVLDLVFGVVWFTVFTTAIATGLGLLILLIGPPIITATFFLARAGAWFERRRVRLFLGTAIEEPVRRPRQGHGILQWLVAPLRDRTTWKELLYLWLVQPTLSILNFTATLVAWTVPLWAITLPIYAIAWPGAAPEVWSGRRLDSPLETLLTAAAGVVLLPLAPWIVRGLAALDAAVARALLSASRAEALEERIDTLRETQARSVDMAIADRRQIERDLHDGAQQRLLALGIDLGRALEKFESDPEAARALVGDAHEEVQRAVVELRDLARGIHPAVLTDRGLDAALSALAARSPVPVRLDVALPERPSASVEATAYFIVAEAITNAVKHGNGSRIDVRVRLDGDTLRIDVSDDGVGGATERPGGGLAGLADRASAVEGTLRVTSPAGGPTVVAAELPCGS